MSQGSPIRPAGGMITAGPARAASRAMLKAVGSAGETTSRDAL